MLVVLGNACADLTCYVAALPRPGETVLAGQMHEDIGGKGINQAIAAGRAGAQVRLVTALGEDAAGAAIRNVLRREEIGDEGLTTGGPISDRSIILVDSRGENSIVSHAGQAQGMDWEQVDSRLRLAPGDSLLLQGNLSAAVTAAAVRRAKSAGARVIVNAAPMQAWLRELSASIDLLVVNHLEACQWAGLPETATAACAIARLGVPRACITVGGGGCLVLDANRSTAIAAPVVAAVDTTGAGDVFTGTLAAEWSGGAALEDAARLGVLAASDKVQRRGVVSAFPSRTTIRSLRAQTRRDFCGK